MSEVYQAPPQANPPNRKRLIATILVIIGIVGIGFILLILLNLFVVRPIRVEGTAMAPTLNNGDKIFVSKRLGTLTRGDIVVFYYPGDTSKSFIKRIIGLPGERLDIDADGHLTINERILKEDYIEPARNQAAQQRGGIESDPNGKT